MSEKLYKLAVKYPKGDYYTMQDMDATTLDEAKELRGYSIISEWIIIVRVME